MCTIFDVAFVVPVVFLLEIVLFPLVGLVLCFLLRERVPVAFLLSDLQVDLESV